MTKPTAEQFEIYRAVKNYLESEADMRRYGYLSSGESVYAEGKAEVEIGGSEGPIEDAVVKYEERSRSERITTRVERRELSSAVKCVAACATYLLLAAACQRPATTTAATESISFQPPTATEAFNLRSRCVQLGQKFSKDNGVLILKQVKQDLADSELEEFGPAFQQDYIYNYNSKTNHCYVEVTIVPTDAEKSWHYRYQSVRDAQTGDTLAEATWKEIKTVSGPLPYVISEKGFVNGDDGRRYGPENTAYNAAVSRIYDLMGDDHTKR